MSDARPVKRGAFGFTAKPEGVFDPDGDLEATSGEQGVAIAVTQERAVDSYNAMFTCEAVLPRDEAERLRDWLIEVLA